MQIVKLPSTNSIPVQIPIHAHEGTKIRNNSSVFISNAPAPNWLSTLPHIGTEIKTNAKIGTKIKIDLHIVTELKTNPLIGTEIKINDYKIR